MNTCICCGGIIVEFDFRDSFLGNFLCRCKNCGHVQISEAPPPSVVRYYYQSSYSVERGNNLGTGYERVMRKRAAAQVKYMQRHMSLDGASIMDIGCGFGHLLLSVSKFTKIFKGYDYDPLAVDSCKAKGLPVEYLETEGQLSDFSSADLCVLSHCLEHFVNPSDTLRLLGEKCKRIFIEVPIYNPDIKEQFCDLEGHMHFFNMNSLQCFFRNNGFDIIDITACGPSISLFYVKKWCVICKLFQIATHDFFFNQYRVSRKAGIWARALIRYGGVA